MAELFQSACSTTASAYPTSTYSTRAAAERLTAASPQPMPVIDVNSGCANGERTPRRMSTASTPPSCPTRPPDSANARPM